MTGILTIRRKTQKQSIKFLAILPPFSIGAAPDNTCLWLGVESVRRVYTKTTAPKLLINDSVDGVHLLG